MIRISGIITCATLFVLLLSGCGGARLPAETPTPDLCSAEELREIIATMDEVAKRFEDVTHLAADTPPENLEPVIKEMQGVKQEVEEVGTPPCAIKTKAALDSYMFSEIQCYFKIYAGAVVETPLADRGVKDSCSLAPDKLEYYHTKMDELKVLLLEKSRLDTQPLTIVSLSPLQKVPH